MTRPAKKQRVNYDLIAHLYDEPARDHVADPQLDRFLHEHPGLDLSALRILDMGCGTGNQLAADQAHWPSARFSGLDLFHGMLQQARRRNPRVSWIRGDSAVPPLKDESCDYITNQFSYSHVLDQETLLVETFRILKRGGRFVMTHIDPWSMRGWAVYRYFPPAWDRDAADFLPAEEFAARLQAAGFAGVQCVRRQRNESVTLQELLDYARARYRASQLIALTDDAYAAGLAGLSAEVAARGGDARVDSELCLVSVTGDKPV